jgi:hypothetical protein
MRNSAGFAGGVVVADRSIPMSAARVSGEWVRAREGVRGPRHLVRLVPDRDPVPMRADSTPRRAPAVAVLNVVLTHRLPSTLGRV